MPRRLSSPRRWPVSFRPLCGEILYSWLARTAGIYELCPEELLPEKNQYDAISTLVQTPHPSVLESLAASSGVSGRALAKRTLDGTTPRWPSNWWLAAHAGNDIDFTEASTPPLQICPRCLAEDGHSSGAVQFLRLRWQCSAMTICQKHLTPLEQACIHCHRICWPICVRIAFQRFGFLCGHCGSPQEQSGWACPEPDAAAIRLLARFENQLVRALANQTVEWCWIGYATPQEFLLLVEDLLWAVTRDSFQSRPIYKLYAAQFPLPNRTLPAAARCHWRFGCPSTRRSLLAAVLGIFGCPKARSLLQGRGTYAFRWYELLVCLTVETIADLERRSWHWPPAAHNAFRRAAHFPRDKRFFHAMGNSPLSTDISKTKRAACAVY